MKNKSEVKFKKPGSRQADPPASKPSDRRRLLKHMTCALAISLLCGGGALAQNDNNNGASPDQLRQFIGQQVGGIQKLTVPPTNDKIPVPRAPDGTVPYRFQTTESKRYLAKPPFPHPLPTPHIAL